MEVPLVDEGAKHERVAVHHVEEEAGQLAVHRGHEVAQGWLVAHSVQVDHAGGLPGPEAVMVEGMGAVLWRRGGMRTVDVLVLGPPRPRLPQLLLALLAGLRLVEVPHLLPLPLLVLLDLLLAASRLVVGAA